MTDLLDHLVTRRSVQAAFLEAPAPDEDQIAQMLTIAARVPDHGKLEPWRFIRFAPERCEKFGALLARRMQEKEPDLDADRLVIEKERLSRAPLVIAVVSSPKRDAPVPEWEQVMSAGAVCMNLIHAAYAMGFAAQWLSEWFAFDAAILKELGLEEGEQIAGFIHIGTPSAKPADRPRPDLDQKVSFWEG